LTWERNGIEGRGEFPPALVDRFQGKAMVLGSGRSIWDDLSRFNHKGYGVVAVNNMTLHYRDQVDHSVSMHPDEPELWRKLRKIYNCLPCELITHSPVPTNQKSETDYTWYFEKGQGGTSGLFAVMLALALGYDRVVLCGMPLDDLGHFYDPPNHRDGCFRSDFIHSEWNEVNKLYFNNRVKSLSGWTRNLLGEPDESWRHS
jgi:hypothetical protein